MKTKEEAEALVQLIQKLGELKFNEKNHLWIRHIQIAMEVGPTKVDHPSVLLPMLNRASTETIWHVMFSFKGASILAFGGFAVDACLSEDKLKDKDVLLDTIQGWFFEDNDLARVKLDYDFYLASTE